MKKTLILLFVIVSCAGLTLKSQNLQELQDEAKIDNARYLDENLGKLLKKKIKYPLDALDQEIQGDVVLSIIIDEQGNPSNIEVKSSPFKSLSYFALVSVKNLKNKWTPCKVNDVPVSKDYLMVFRYRHYIDEGPPRYKRKADKFVKRQMYEKALTNYNLAIKDNPFDHEALASRSKLKEILGDTEGAKNDLEQSVRLRNSVLAVVNIEGKEETEIRGHAGGGSKISGSSSRSGR